MKDPTWRRCNRSNHFSRSGSAFRTSDVSDAVATGEEGAQNSFRRTSASLSHEGGEEDHCSTFASSNSWSSACSSASSENLEVSPKWVSDFLSSEETRWSLSIWTDYFWNSFLRPATAAMDLKHTPGMLNKIFGFKVDQSMNSKVSQSRMRRN